MNRSEKLQREREILSKQLVTEINLISTRPVLPSRQIVDTDTFVWALNWAKKFAALKPAQQNTHSKSKKTQ